MIRLFAICVVCSLSLVSFGQATTDLLPLPVVVLVGDSIRLSYAPMVATRLAEKARVVSPKPNGGDSSNVLKHLQEWVIAEKPDVVHFNCGIHDGVHLTTKAQELIGDTVSAAVEKQLSTVTP